MFISFIHMRRHIEFRLLFSLLIGESDNHEMLRAEWCKSSTIFLMLAFKIEIILNVISENEIRKILNFQFETTYSKQSLVSPWLNEKNKKWSHISASATKFHDFWILCNFWFVEIGNAYAYIQGNSTASFTLSFIFFFYIFSSELFESSIKKKKMFT